MRNLVIRADAGSEIGIGHVMRCLALAQGWQETGGGVYFVIATYNPELERRILHEGMNIIHSETIPGSLEDSMNLIKIVREMGADWVVVDGYHFGARYQMKIKEAGLFLLFIDDYGHADHYYADIILNQNIYAEPSIYRYLEPYTQLILGTRYALLRKEFLKFSEWKRDIPEIARKVLVTLGGGDPQNVTLTVIESLKKIQIDGLDVIIIVGGANPHYFELNRAVKNFPNFKIINSGVDMPELMAWADIAISAGGSTNLELAFMGIPAITINFAENQVLNSQVLEKNGVSENLGWYENVDSDKIFKTVDFVLRSQKKRIAMCEIGNKLVDGNGVRYLTDLIRSKKMQHKGRVVYQKEGTQIIDCEICGFKHINPIPSDAEIENFYKKTYFNQIRNGKKGMNLKHFLDSEDEADAEMQWLISTSYRDVNEMLSRFICQDSRNLCDIGCGSGFFLKYMSNLGWNSIGIEPSENADYESQNLRIFNTTLDGFISKNKEYNHFFDAVTLFGVLEHATNPSDMIDSVKQLLKPGGILFVNVPNDFSVLQLAATKSLNIEPWWPSIPDHINYFSMDSLKKFLESTGFTTIEATTDFPMELFLLMGENYIQNNKTGSICHQKRKQFEQSIPSTIRQDLYSCFARHSMGRCCIVYASHNYPSEKSS